MAQQGPEHLGPNRILKDLRPTLLSTWGVLSSYAQHTCIRDYTLSVPDCTPSVPLYTTDFLIKLLFHKDFTPQPTSDFLGLIYHVKLLTLRSCMAK